ncbi:MAG: hypothetical protein Q4G25_11990 [Paracoccus sp. (in: a-proteobacteria)]|nr:hypothetical protein [Paracoccus sp. (in: a-proteobacteria)]
MTSFGEGRPPAQAMVRADTDLYRKWTQPVPGPWKGPPYRLPDPAPAAASWSPLGGPVAGQPFDPGSIPSLQSYVLTRDSNHLVPTPAPGAEQAGEAEAEEKGGGPKWKFGQVERKTEDGGIGVSYSEKETVSIDGTYKREEELKIDDDWGGKWKDATYSVVEVSERAKGKLAVADGDFGDADSFWSGNGAVLGIEGSAGYKGAITNKGVEASVDVKGEIYAAKGEIATRDDLILSGKAEAAVLAAEAEAKGELKLTAEQATLGGKLGASANLVEGKASGEFAITPTRISRAAVSVYNWMFNANATPLSDDWDFGIVLNGEISGAVGAQAKAEADAGLKDGDLRFQAGAKLGLGVGAGVKVGGGLTGMDKAWGQIKAAWNWLWD